MISTTNPTYVPKRRTIVMAAMMMFVCCNRDRSLQGQTMGGGLPERPQSANVVVHWNRIAAEIFTSEPGPLLDSRALCILHAAIHDALNNIDRRYEPYTSDRPYLGASVEAAVARAARDVMVALAPSHRERIDREFTAAMSAVPDGPSKNAGLNLGDIAAHANLDRRSGDGLVPGPWPPQTGPITQPVYVPTRAPGDYDFTPPFDAPPLGPVALFPGFGRLTPFAIDLERHRLKGPDPLKSTMYARDVNLVKSVGGLKSATRTPDQTATAFFWFEEQPIWNQIARTVILERRLDPWDAARLLALMNFALTDSTVAAFEAKYHFRFWRPYTAIRRAAEDGNDYTEADPDWLPLLWPTSPDIPPTFFIPPIPDYPSVAAASSAAAAEVLTEVIGDHASFEASSPTLPVVTRRFRSFRHAALEAGLSRLFGGIHFLHAVADGFVQGKSVGREVRHKLPSSRR
jgi:hypothetical protein